MGTNHGRVSALRVAGAVAVAGASGIAGGVSWAGPANAAATPGATVRPVTKAISVGGNVWARANGQISVDVTAPANTVCVKVAGAHSAKQNGPAKVAWSFPFTTKLGDGARNLTVTTFSATWADGSCKGTATATYTTKYTEDDTAPALAPTVGPSVNAAGWSRGTTVTWAVSDGGVGLDPATVPAVDTVTVQGWSTRKATVADLLGNTRTGSVQVKNDDSAPNVTVSVTPAAGPGGWFTGTPKVAWACNDAVSGLASCPSPVYVSAEGAQTISGTAYDKAGGATTVSATVKVDRTPPVLTGASTTQADGSTLVHWTCSDALSGIAGSCPADRVFPAGTAAPYAFAVVSDLAGNQTTAAVGDRNMQFGGSIPYEAGKRITDSYAEFESQIGRPLGAIRQYVTWDEGYWGMANDKQLTANGAVLWTSIESKRKDGSVILWSDIANAKPGDAVYADMVSWAQRVSAFGRPVVITFQHEPEVFGSANGTAEDFKAAWRTFVGVFRAQGVPNVSFNWNVSAWSFTSDKAQQWYPGDDVVDSIGGDGYNWFSCRGAAPVWKTFSSIFEPMRQFGMQHPNVALTIPEFGSVEDHDTPGRKAAWIDDALATLKSKGWEQFTAVAYWDSVDHVYEACDWRIDSSAPTLSSVQSFAQDPFFG